MATATSFGEFIIAKRREKELSARQLALALHISPVYLCDIEKGRKCMVTDELLEQLRRLLALSEEESELMYDLVATAQKSISVDLPEYIMEHEIVRTALRTAKKHKVSDEKWERFIAQITQNDDKE